MLEYMVSNSGLDKEHALIQRLYWQCDLHAFNTMMTRLRLEYHSLEQVCVGSAVGALMGVVWYVLVQQVLFPLAEYFQVVDGWIGQMFLLRDTRSVGGLMAAQRSWSRDESKSKNKHE